MITKWDLNRSQRLLCQALSERPLPERTLAARNLIEHLSDEAAFSLAEKNQVASVAAHSLIGESKIKDVSNHWKQAHIENNKKITSYLNELDRIANRLLEKGISLVALKNVGIARGIYPCVGCCPMGDIDVLVERRHFRKTHEILKAEGYHLEFRNPLEDAELNAAEEGGGAEYWKILQNGKKLWFELQWRPVAGRWIRPDQEPTTEELMARSISIPGTAVRLLAAEDNLLQVALHTAKHTYVRAPGFRLHLDVERIVHGYPDLDWDLFVQRVKALQVKTAVYFSLQISHDLFGTPIPRHVFTALRPPAWKERVIVQWLNRVGLFNPDERKFGKLAYILFSSLLYDSFLGLLRGLFPTKAWMRDRYNVRYHWVLPFFYVRRLIDLAFRRVNT